MTFRIDNYLNAATQDKETREKIICIYDNLYTAYKIVESVKDASKLEDSPSENILLAAFYELQKAFDKSN